MVKAEIRGIGQELKKRLEPMLRQPLGWFLIDRLAALQEREEALARVEEEDATPGEDLPRGPS